MNAAAGEANRDRAGGRVAPSAPLTWTGFTGRLDELAIYGTALDPVRIAAHYAAR